MDSDKVKEIKKALKFMMGLDLSNKLPYIDGNTIKQIAYEEIFNYINDLESENERLLEQRNKTYNIWVKDTEQLKNRIAELTKENKDYYDKFNNLQAYIDNHEEIWKGNTNNALKKFVERLKEKAIKQRWQGLGTTDIDKTLKEFLDGKG